MCISLLALAALILICVLKNAILLHQGPSEGSQKTYHMVFVSWNVLDSWPPLLKPLEDDRSKRTRLTPLNPGSNRSPSRWGPCVRGHVNCQASC